MAVQQVNATVLDGRIWVAGGVTSSGEATASTQFYDPAINSWDQGPPLPEPLNHAMLVTYHDQLVVIGGFHGRGHDLLAETSARMLLLDNKTGKWVDGPPLGHPRGAGGAAVVGDKIVVVGGRTGNPEQLVTQTEIFDGTSWRDAANIPVPGDHLAVTADSRYLYAVGGRKFTASSNTDAVQRYDPKANRWTILPPTPQPVGGAGVAIVRRPTHRCRRRKAHQRLRHCPGLRPERPHRHLDHLALPRPGPPRPRGHRHRQYPLRRRRRHQTRTHRLHQPRRSTGHTGTTSHAAAAWRPRHEVPVAVQQVNATVLDGRIWVAGGVTSSGEATASTQFYDPAINSWDQGPPLPEPLNHAMLVTYHNQLAVIGGFHSRDHDLLAETSARMLLLDNKTGKWVDGPPLRHPRAAGGAAVVGDKIVVVGGRTGNPEQLVTQTEIFDGTSWRDAADIPVPGDHLAVTADSSYLYAVGGRKFTAGSNKDVVQRYDPKADRWDILTPDTGTGQRRRRRHRRRPTHRRRRRKGHQRLRHRPGLRPERPQRHLDHPARPRPRAATASGSPPSAIPSTPSAAPPKPDTPHPPTSSQHSASRNGPAVDPGDRHGQRARGARPRVGDPSRHRLQDRLVELDRSKCHPPLTLSARGSRWTVADASYILEDSPSMCSRYVREDHAQSRLQPVRRLLA